MSAIFESRDNQYENNVLQQSFSELSALKDMTWKDVLSEDDGSHGNDPIILGYDASRKPVYWTYETQGNSTPFDPHLLVYGESGSGRELFTKSITNQITEFDDATLYIIDPTGNELLHFRRKAEVVWTDDGINTMLSNIVETIMKRFHVLEEQSCNYYSRLIGTSYEMPKIFLVINHLDDVLRTTANESYVSSICRLGRAAGVFVVATAQTEAKQRIPDGGILANIGARVTIGYCKTNPYDNTPNKCSNLIPRGPLTGVVSFYDGWSKAFRLPTPDVLR